MSRHDIDLLSFLCGVIFVGLGLTYIITATLGVRIHAVWALPGLLVALGAAGLVGTTRRTRRRGDDYT